MGRSLSSPSPGLALLGAGRDTRGGEVLPARLFQQMALLKLCLGGLMDTRCLGRQAFIFSCNCLIRLNICPCFRAFPSPERRQWLSHRWILKSSTLSHILRVSASSSLHMSVEMLAERGQEEVMAGLWQCLHVD